MSARRGGLVRALAAALAGAALLVGTASARADEPTAEERLSARAPAIVVLRGVFELRLSMGGQNQALEIKSDGLGAVVDPSGLVLVLDPEAVAKRLEGRLEGLSVSIRTKSLKLVAADGAERDVVQVVRDGTLGFGFLQVVEPSGPMAFVDLSTGAALSSGASLLGVKRLSRGFDHAAIVQRCYVTHRLEKPRLVWGLSGDFDEMGLPVFDREGRPVGVVGFQESAEGIDVKDVASSLNTVVVPLEPVRKALEQAKKRVPEALARAKASLAPGAEGGTTPPAPEGREAPEAPKAPETPPTPDAPKAPDAPR